MNSSDEYTMLQWADGHVSDYEAAKALLNDYWSLSDRKAELEAKITGLRAKLERITQHAGPMDIAGQGRLELTQATLVKGYDRAALDELIIEMTQVMPAVAQLIAQCRTETPRKGGLKVTREKAS